MSDNEIFNPRNKRLKCEEDSNNVSEKQTCHEKVNIHQNNNIMVSQTALLPAVLVAKFEEDVMVVKILSQNGSPAPKSVS